MSGASGVSGPGGAGGVLVLAGAEDTRALGRALAAVLRAGDLVVLSGPLGAGKTVLAQGLGEGLGVRGPVTSPTFVISRVHPSTVGGPALVHVDAYRLASAAEVDDLDLDASLPDAVTVVEWGEGLVEQLAADRLEVALARPLADGADGSDGSDGADGAGPGGAGGARRAVVRGVGPRWAGVALPGA